MSWTFQNLNKFDDKVDYPEGPVFPNIIESSSIFIDNYIIYINQPDFFFFIFYFYWMKFDEDI